MKKRHLFFTAITLAFAISSCSDSEKGFTEEVKNPETSEIFDFKTRTEVSLNLDYGFEGYKVPFEIFTSNPLDEDGRLLPNAKPIFAAFTDYQTSFNGKIELPAHTEKIYLYSDAKAIDKLIELDVNNGKLEYIYKGVNAGTRDVSYQGECISIAKNKTVINSKNKLFGLYTNYNTTLFDSDNRYIPENKNVSGLYKVINNNEKIAENSTLGELLKRINKTLKKVDNSKYCRDSEITNIRIATHTPEGEEVKGAHIDLTYLAASGDYHNAMGYYYYKTGETNPTKSQISAMPKYIVFPRTTANTPNARVKARLQFFGENYDQDGVDNFPGGYTIGWILIADLNSKKPKLGDRESLSNVNARINDVYETQSIYSNKEANKAENSGCITLTDELSQKVVIGFEDQTFRDMGDKSYEDILFYVDCDPITAIFDPNRPPVVPPVEEEFKYLSKSSTLAFEDLWPDGGDYDMNDVVVELDNEITFNQDNMIKKIVTTVKPTNNGATLKNAFGVIFNGLIGAVEEDESNYYTREESNQFIFFDDIKGAMGKTFTLVRTFGEEGIDKENYDESINPFIVVRYSQDEKDRVEVHLPTYAPTPWIDPALVGSGNDIFYVDKSNKIYPFAFELFDKKDWVVVTEKVKIGSPGEYSAYVQWAESKGDTNKDWYLHKN